MTEWRAIPGLPDYAISEYGQVQRLTSARTRRAGHMPTGHIRNGYWAFKLVKPDGEKQCFWAHRLVALAFIGPQPAGYVIAHYDGNRLNNHYSNLRWTTNAGNGADAVRHGTTMRGERNCHAKLTPEQVQAVRAEYVGRWGQQSALARKYGLCHSAMRDVLIRKHWKHV